MCNLKHLAWLGMRQRQPEWGTMYTQTLHILTRMWETCGWKVCSQDIWQFWKKLIGLSYDVLINTMIIYETVILKLIMKLQLIAS